MSIFGMSYGLVTDLGLIFAIVMYQTLCQKHSATLYLPFWQMPLFLYESHYLCTYLQEIGTVRKVANRNLVTPFGFEQTTL